MPSSIGKKALGGFAAIYNETQGTDAQKVAAVTAEFERLRQAQLTTEEVNRAFAASMTTSDAKAKQFNEQLAATIERMQGALLPALEKLAPAVLKAADGFTNMLTSPGFQKSVGAAQNVLALVGLSEGANQQEEQQKSGWAAQADALAWKGTLGRWMQLNLATNAEGIADPMKELAKAQVVLAPTEQKMGGIQAQIDPLAKQLAKDEAYFSETKKAYGPDYDKRLHELAGKGNEQAEKVLNERASLAQLQDTLKQIQAERDQLVRVLTNGSVTVRLQTPLNADTSGTTPPGVGGHS
jgi:hypothetical protein